MAVVTVETMSVNPVMICFETVRIMLDQAGREVTYGEGTLSDDDQRTVDDGDGLSRSLKGLRLLGDHLDIADHLRRREGSLNDLAAKGEDGNDSAEDGETHFEVLKEVGLGSN